MAVVIWVTSCHPSWTNWEYQPVITLAETPWLLTLLKEPLLMANEPLRKLAAVRLEIRFFPLLSSLRNQRLCVWNITPVQ